ncbi:MAG TPA: hypothetical protein VGM58_02510, partial [Verrucomicrobiae bacterium]
MAEPKENPIMEKIVSLCKRRGFVFQSSEIYGGINGFWDYGPLGAELKRNVKELWWHAMTRQRDDVAGLEATIIMSPQIWKASGHVDTFADLMVECPITKKRFRADQIEPQSGTAFYFSGAVCGDNEQAREAIDEVIRLNGRIVETQTIIDAITNGKPLNSLSLQEQQQIEKYNAILVELKTRFEPSIDKAVKLTSEHEEREDTRQKLVEEVVGLESVPHYSAQDAAQSLLNKLQAEYKSTKPF